MKTNLPNERSQVRPGATAGDVLGRPGSKTTVVPPHWRWHQRVLLNLRARLVQQRNDSRRAAGEPLEAHGMDEADSATDEFDHALALTQLATEDDALFEIDSALDRIHRGAYGICEATGKMIPDARLKAIPWTRYTFKAARQREKEKLVRPPHLAPAVSLKQPPSGPPEGR